jgi:hypothetical protein
MTQQMILLSLYKRSSIWPIAFKFAWIWTDHHQISRFLSSEWYIFWPRIWYYSPDLTLHPFKKIANLEANEYFPALRRPKYALKYWDLSSSLSHTPWKWQITQCIWITRSRLLAAFCQMRISTENSLLKHSDNEYANGNETVLFFLELSLILSTLIWVIHYRSLFQKGCFLFNE